MKTILILLLVPFCLACATIKVNRDSVKKGYVNFGITEPNNEWQQKSFRGADLYFEHSSGWASIYFNAQCQRISDSTLEALFAQMLVGLTEVKVHDQGRVLLTGREGLVSELTAKIDGVERFLKTMVLRKNACVFDGVFNSSVEKKDLKVSFDQMLDSFWAEVKL